MKRGDIVSLHGDNNRIGIVVDVRPFTSKNVGIDADVRVRWIERTFEAWETWQTFDSLKAIYDRT